MKQGNPKQPQRRSYRCRDQVSGESRLRAKIQPAAETRELKRIGGGDSWFRSRPVSKGREQWYLTRLSQQQGTEPSRSPRDI